MNTQHTQGKVEVVSPERMNAPKYTISGMDPEGARYQPIATLEAGNGNVPHLKIDREAQKANADFIALAWNCHGEMLEALKVAGELIERTRFPMDESAARDYARNLIRNAIANATR